MIRIQALSRALALLASLFVLTSLAGGALAAEPAEEGTDYTRLAKPLPVETGKQIEVVEFFWYRCPHCNQLEPGLSAWAKKLPKDVKLRPVPAVFNPGWLPGAKLHYALEDLGAQERLRGKVFEAYHKEKRDLDNEDELMAWVKKQGLDEARFKAAYNSFSTQTRATKGDRLTRAAGISGVPALMVDGKYLTSVSMTYTEERLFEVLDQLISRARAERGGKKARP